MSAVLAWTVLVFALGFWAGAVLNWQTPIVRWQAEQIDEHAKWRAKVEVVIAKLESYLERAGNGPR